MSTALLRRGSRSIVHPEVKRLLKTRELNRFDYDWIKRLRVEIQCEAALKCIRDFNLKPAALDRPKSCMGTKVEVKF